MTQDAFLLLALAVLGVYALQWTRRLSQAWGELPVKTLAATLIAGVVAAAELTGNPLGPTVRSVALVLSAPFVLSPLLVAALARLRRYRLADFVTSALYWTQPGRDAIRRIVVQAALQQGDADAALERMPARDDVAMRAQALAAKGAHESVLALPSAGEGDPGYLADGARVQALVGLGRVDEADRLVAEMRSRFERGSQSPIGYRSIKLAETRVDAERGNLRRVRETLREPLVGVPADELYGLIARAAEVAGDRAVAARVYQEAARMAPESRRRRYAERLEAWGEQVPPPVRVRRRARATAVLAGVIALSYLGQHLLDTAVGAFVVGTIPIRASSIAAAFGLGLPGFPFADAWWRYLSYAFVHAGIVHIGFNVWVLYDLGRVFEARRGWGDLLAAFALGTAMGAYLTSVAQAGDTLLLVGASGGVLGVAGALLADVLRSREPHDRALMRSLLQWMALITLLSVAIPNVSLWGHVGGVIGGMLWAFARQGLPAGRRISEVAGLIAIAALLAAVTQVVSVALALL